MKRTQLMLATVPFCVFLGSCIEGGNAPAGISVNRGALISLTNGIGRPIASGSGLVLRYFAYDSRGRVTASEHVLDDVAYLFSTNYGFACSNNACTGGPTSATNGSVIISEVLPDSGVTTETVNYTYDAGGARQAITTTPSGGVSETIVSRVTRNPRGLVAATVYGDGTTTERCYNDGTKCNGVTQPSSDLRLNALETYVTATPTTFVQLYQYAYDGTGNTTTLNDYCNETNQGVCNSSAPNTTYSASYQYDSRGQLVQATRNSIVYPYGYDSIGNLTGKEGTSQLYYPSGTHKPIPHALCSVGGTSCTTGVVYLYDANGDLTATTGASTNPAITWNAVSMPTKTVYGGNTTTRWYQDAGLWKRQFGSATTYYLPSERVENGRFRKYFSGYAERDIDDTSSCTTNATRGCLKYYHSDYLASSTLALNPAYPTTNPSFYAHREGFKPYGESLAAVGPFTPKLKFNNKEQEQDGSGFYDYGARLYNPATGRWLSPDTSTADGLNRYQYVRNNPLRYQDPTGRQSSDKQIVTYGDLRFVLLGPGPDVAKAKDGINAYFKSSEGHAALLEGSMALTQFNARHPDSRESMISISLVPGDYTASRTDWSNPENANITWKNEKIISGPGSSGDIELGRKQSSTEMAAVFAHEFSHVVKGLEGNAVIAVPSQSDPNRDLAFIGQTNAGRIVIEYGRNNTNLEEDRAMGIGPFFTSTSANSFRLRIGLEEQRTHWEIPQELRIPPPPEPEMKTMPLFGR